MVSSSRHQSCHWVLWHGPGDRKGKWAYILQNPRSPSSSTLLPVQFEKQVKCLYRTPEFSQGLCCWGWFWIWPCALWVWPRALSAFSIYTSNIHEQTLARPLRVRVQHSYIHLNGNFKRALLRSGSCKSNSLTTIENCHPQRSGIKKAFAWQVWQASTTGWMLSCMVHVCQPRPHGDGGARLIVTLLRNTSANSTISGQEPRWCTHAVYAKV